MVMVVRARALVVLAFALGLFPLGAILGVHGVDLDVLFVGEDASNAEEHERARAAQLVARRFEAVCRLKQRGFIRFGVLNHFRKLFLATIDGLLLCAQHWLGGLINPFDARGLLRGERELLLKPLGLPPLEAL